MKTILSLILMTPFISGAQTLTPPKLHFNPVVTRSHFDEFWCKSSMIPAQDPIFTEIKKSRFKIDPTTDELIIPDEWFKEANEVRSPQLKAAAEKRWPQLLSKTIELVGRPFDQKDFDFFFYLCPYFGGGNGYAKVFPMFMYLESAVGKAQQWPDWLFTDQYLFHEVLHAYAAERIDFLKKGTPTVNALYWALLYDAKFEADSKKYLKYPDPITPEYQELWKTKHQAEMIGGVLIHVHVYGAMIATLEALGDREKLNNIRKWETNNADAHPSYVKAWEYATEISKNPVYMRTLLNELK